jgi:hypothetical protein
VRPDDVKRVLIVLGVVVSATLSLAGCAGQPATAAVDSAFATRALAVCTSVMESKQAWAPFPAGSFDPTKPDPAKLANVGGWLESEVAPTFTTWHDETVALGDPASGQEGWKAVVTGLESNVTLVGKQIAAANAGDAGAFASATRDLQANHEAFITAAKAAGVAACGDIVSS